MLDWLIDLATYQSDNQRNVQVFGAVALAASAVLIAWKMARIPRKPWLDKALTVKQAWLVLLGVRGAVAVVWDRPAELWGTLIWLMVGVASIGVMIETFVEERHRPEAWEDPYQIIETQRRRIAELETDGRPMRDHPVT